VEARDHRDLFQDLRRLRQREKLAGVNARRDDKVACPFRRRFQQYRRLDLKKAASVEVLADRPDRLRTHDDVLLKLRTAQVEIAVLEPRILAREVLAAGNLELKRGYFRVVKYEQFANLDLYVAGLEFEVAGAFVAFHNGTLYGDHELAAEGLRF